MSVALLLWLLTATHAADWPCFLGPTHDGKSAEKGEFNAWGDNGPPIRWTLAAGAGYCAPSVAGGKLYVFERQGNANRLTCRQAADARELWRFEYPASFTDQYGYDNGPRCCPVIDGDRVYLFGPEGMLHCLSAADGKVIWKLDTTTRFNVVQNFFGVGAAPIIEGDLLICQIGGSPPDSPPTISGKVKGNGSGVVAFDKLTGEVRYQLSDELASYSTPIAAQIEGRRWCFVLARGGLIGFNPADGKQDFHYPWRATITESVNAASPVVVGDRVFISETYGPGSSLLKVKPGGYDLLWKDEAPSGAKKMQAHWATPIHVDGYLYGCSGRHSGNAELRCIELAGGKIMWKQPGLTRSSLMYVDGRLVLLTEFGQLALLKVNPRQLEPVFNCIPKDSATGEQLIQEPAWAAPILSDGLMFIRGHGKLICFELLKSAK